MEDKMLIVGKIHFDPVSLTNKHHLQSSWKYLALVKFDSDIDRYYSWYVAKRFNLKLNLPIRGPHVSFINDSFNDISKNKYSRAEVKTKWDALKNKWHGIDIPIMLDLNAKTNGKHWWLNVHHDYRERLHMIRSEIGLERPFFGLHLTFGSATGRMEAHSIYIHELIKNGLVK